MISQKLYHIQEEMFKRRNKRYLLTLTSRSQRKRNPMMLQRSKEKQRKLNHLKNLIDLVNRWTLIWLLSKWMSSVKLDRVLCCLAILRFMIRLCSDTVHLLQHNSSRILITLLLRVKTQNNKRKKQRLKKLSRLFLRKYQRK